MISVDCTSEKPHFKCGNNSCLEYGFRCNGIIDCVNATDEKDCGWLQITLNRRLCTIKCITIRDKLDSCVI